MWPDRVSNPVPLTYMSGALLTVLLGPAFLDRIHLTVLRGSAFLDRIHLLGTLCKQCRPSSNAAKCGVQSGSTLLAYRNFYAKYNKSKTSHQKPLKLQMDLSKW